MNGSEKTILLVEDNEDDAYVFKRTLRKTQLEVSVQHAVDGDEAVNYLGGTGKFADRTTYPMPVLVFLDLKLPFRSGLEVLSWIRAAPEIANLPVVVLSGSDEARDHERTESLGICGYLVKPASVEDLLQAIRPLVVAV